MDVSKHISQLLFEHNCVIIPDFGGFVTSFAPAKLDVTQHLFTPPHKQISFNKHLKTSDGLLAHRIVQIEHKSFQESDRIIQSFSIELKACLERGDQFYIEAVGTLSLDAEKNIQFEPDNTVNYLPEAFGMSALHLLPIKREGLSEKIEKQFKDRPPIPSEKKRSKIGSYVSIAAIAVIAAIVVSMPFYTAHLKNFNASSLNPFDAKSNQIESVKALSPLLKTTPQSAAAGSGSASGSGSTSASSSATQGLAATQATSPIRNHRDSIASNLVEPDKTKVVTTNQDQNSRPVQKGYFVVCGCFKIEANAVNFVNELRQHFENAAIVGKNKEGLFVVSCGNFSNKVQAYQELARVRTVQKDSWMFEN